MLEQRSLCNTCIFHSLEHNDLLLHKLYRYWNPCDDHDGMLILLDDTDIAKH